MVRRVVWDKPAYIRLQKAYDHIKKESLVAAENVREGILEITRGLAVHPERYPPDKFKIDNQGNFRAFEKFAYRIAYKVTAEEIVILRIRHARQEPRNIDKVQDTRQLAYTL